MGEEARRGGRGEGAAVKPHHDILQTNKQINLVHASLSRTRVRPVMCCVSDMKYKMI